MAFDVRGAKVLTLEGAYDISQYAGVHLALKSHREVGFGNAPNRRLARRWYGPIDHITPLAVHRAQRQPRIDAKMFPITLLHLLGSIPLRLVPGRRRRRLDLALSLIHI